MSHIYCPECGFQNPEAANYCAKCGALLHERESESVEQTQTFTPEDRDELLETLGDIGVHILYFNAQHAALYFTELQ